MDTYAQAEFFPEGFVACSGFDTFATHIVVRSTVVPGREKHK